MDNIVQIFIFIILLVIIGIISYVIFDYMNYKNGVDKSFDTTLNQINESFEKVSGNVGNVQTEISKNAQIIDKNDKDIKKIQTTVNNNADILTTKIEDIEEQNINFDTALKKYFTFYDNNNNLQNDKLFDHVFSSISPNLDLRAHVNATSGMIVRTPEETTDIKNFKICNSLKNCISLNVNSEGFSITPEDVSNMTIKSKSNKTLANFDMKNDSIYIGGSNNKAPFYVENNDVFLKNKNVNDIINDVSTLKKYMNREA